MKANESKPLDRNWAIECEAIDAICVLELAEYVLLKIGSESGNGNAANKLLALRTALEDQRARLDDALNIPMKTGGDGR